MLAPWKKSYDQPRQILKSWESHFQQKFMLWKLWFSSSHVRMWELDHKESGVPKNWCFWTVVLKKTLESPLDCKEIKPVHPKGNQPWILIGRTVMKLKLQYFGHLMWELTHWKRPCCRERHKAGGEGEVMVRWHHQLDGHESEQAPGVGDRQGGLECCSPWGRKQSVTTEQLNWICRGIFFLHLLMK